MRYNSLLKKPDRKATTFAILLLYASKVNNRRNTTFYPVFDGIVHIYDSKENVGILHNVSEAERKSSALPYTGQFPGAS